MATVEQDIQNFQASGERNLAELKRVLSEEKKVEEKTQDRLSELANILRKQYSDKPDDDLIVIKETITTGKGKDRQEYTRYRGMTTDEKLQRRKERGEQTLLDIWQMGELPKAMRNWRDASNWVKDSDNGVLANMVRHILGDNSKNIEKRTERIEGRENIELEIQSLEKQQEIEENFLKEFESLQKEALSEVENLSSTPEKGLERNDNSNEKVVDNTVSLLSDIISSNNMDKEAIVKGESASDKENKAEELSLFNKQNAILKGIYDNTVRLLDSTNKLQILKEQTPSPQDNGGILDNIVDLVDLASNGKVFVKGKSIAGKVLKRGKDILGKGIDTVAKGASKVGNAVSNPNIKNVGNSIVNKVGSTISKVGDTVSKTNLKNIGGSVVNKFGNVVSNTAPQLKNSFSTIFEGAKNIAQKASTSNIATNTINAMKTNTENLLKMGATYTSPIKEGASTLIQKVGNISVPAPISKGIETVAEGASKVGSTVAKGATKVGSLVEKGIGTVAKLGTKGIPFVSTLVSGTMNALEYSSEAEAIDNKVASGEITKEEGERQKKKARGEATGATAGSTVGATIGGALGALGGPIGIAVGSTLGGVIGEGIGGWLGGWFSEEEPPKVAEKPTEVPKPKLSIHEDNLEYHRKLKNGEITKIITTGTVRNKRENVQLIDERTIPMAQYDRRVAEEMEIIRKLPMSKDMTDDEILATAKRNVYSKTDIGLNYNNKLNRIKEYATLDEKTLKEYNDKNRDSYAYRGEIYKDVTIEDVKKAKEDLKTFESQENLQKMYSDQEEQRNLKKDKTELNGVYKTYKDGKVVGQTVVKKGEIISNFDDTRKYGNNDIGFVFAPDEKTDPSQFVKDNPIPTPQKSIHEQYIEEQEKRRNGEIEEYDDRKFGNFVRLETGSVPKNYYDELVSDEEEVIRKLDMSKSMSDEDIRATAKRNVYSRTDVGSQHKYDKELLKEKASLNEKTLKEYNERNRKEHENEIHLDGYEEYKDLTMEDVKKAREDLKTYDSKENLQKKYSEKEAERKDRKDNTVINGVYRTYKDGKVVGETVVKNGKVVSNVDNTRQYGNNKEGFEFKSHENINRDNLFKLRPSTVDKPSEIVNAPTETPKVTPTVTPTVTPKKADEKTIPEKFDDHQAKIKSGETPQIVKIGKKEYVKLGNGSTLRKRAYDEKVANEMEVIRKLPMSKNMSEDEIRATANRNVYSNTDTASAIKKEKSTLMEISKLDENSLKAYNDKKREEHRQNAWGGKMTEYKEVTPEDIKKAKEEIKTLESEEHIQEVYSANEKERKRLEDEAKRKETNKLNPPPKGETVSQTSEVSVVNTADKVNASSDATTISKPSDIGVPPRDDGLVMQNNAEQIKQQEKDASKEMKVEVVNNNVQNINQTNDRRDPMYSRNVDPSYVRTVDERHGIMG